MRVTSEMGANQVCMMSRKPSRKMFQGHKDIRGWSTITHNHCVLEDKRGRSLECSGEMFFDKNVDTLSIIVGGKAVCMSHS